MELIGERGNLWLTFVETCCSFFLLQLVDLKAELYRKQEQFKKEKLGQENVGAGSVLKAKEKVHEIRLSDLKCIVHFNP